jgi:hypothetical protein
LALKDNVGSTSGAIAGGFVSVVWHHPVGQRETEEKIAGVIAVRATPALTADRIERWTGSLMKSHSCRHSPADEFPRVSDGSDWSPRTKANASPWAIWLCISISRTRRALNVGVVGSR